VRILSIGSLYPPHHHGGAELIWRSAVEHEEKHGHEVRVLTTTTRVENPDEGLGEGRDVHRDLPWYWSQHQFPRLAHRRRLALERESIRTLDRHLADFRPEAVVFWSMGGMSLSLLERVRAAGLPAVGVLLDDWLTYAPEVDQWQRTRARLGPLGGLLARAAGAPARLDLATAARWVFMSRTLRDQVTAAGLDVAAARIALRGIDRDGFPPAPERRWTGRLIYLGRVEARKGVAVAIEALAGLPDMSLRVVGPEEPRYGAELRELADSLGLAGRVSFETLPRADLPRALAESDALLFPVVWPEPWGLVPLEAMASGLPVVASGRGGSGEYLRDRENCLIYAQAEDSSALAAQITELAASPELRRHLRAGGLQTSSSLSAESFNDEVLDEILSAVEAGRG